MVKKETIIRARDIADAIEAFAPLDTQAAWDNSGFTVGSPDVAVHKALVALNCTEEIVKEAVAKGCDMLITHHPLIVHAPCMSILEGDVRGDAIAAAIKGGLTVYSSHTPLDKARGGLNDIMAEKLGLNGCEVLGSDGFGVVGTLKEKLNPTDFMQLVKKSFGARNIRCSKPQRCKISKVAVSSGGGQGSIKDALAKGAQVLVTGDVTHHNYYVPAGFMVMDVGHHQSEWPAVDLLERIVKKKFPTFALLQSAKDISPIYYY